MDELLEKFFPDLDTECIEKLATLEREFRSWNSRINLVSRKDMDHFILHHLVHSLALTKWIQFPGGSRILDVGTGGGLPGMPLAICFPDSQFFLCDSITKKAKAVEQMREALGLDNVQVVNKRAENLESTWQFILGRAVTLLPRFLGWIQDNLRGGGTDTLPYGLLYWKGSLYKEELAQLEIEPFAVYPIWEKVPDPYFEEKYIVHLTADQVMHAKLPESDS